MFERPRRSEGGRGADLGERAFTMLELLAVVAILGILAAVIVWAASSP
ncbi:hypothetical protein BH10ACT1_BH10ACT1_28920 [soil metagenome]